jgi:hypothetical protein
VSSAAREQDRDWVRPCGQCYQKLAGKHECPHGRPCPRHFVKDRCEACAASKTARTRPSDRLAGVDRLTEQDKKDLRREDIALAIFIGVALRREWLDAPNDLDAKTLRWVADRATSEAREQMAAYRRLLDTPYAIARSNRKLPLLFAAQMWSPLAFRLRRHAARIDRKRCSR